MNVLQKTTVSCVTLKERSVQCQGLSLKYRLNVICEAHDTHYEVEVALDGRECARATVGGDIEIALTLFDAICQGTVTPCALTEIIDEMRIGL